MKSVETLNPKDKRIIVRVDWNVTLGKALHIVDDTRIVRTLPTIKMLLERGSKQVILISHLGKPKGYDTSLSLSPVVDYASNLLGQKITLLKEGNLPTDPLVMLENIRFWEGEDKNDNEFATQLARMGDFYVDEAFGEAHRESASIVGIPRIIPGYAGLWFIDEVQTVLKVRDSAEHPLVVVMGGAKVDDKIKLLYVLSQKADVILLGGKLANEYTNRGMSLPGKASVMVPVEGSNLLDIGPETQNIYRNEIAKAKTVVWNGPMGMVEDPKYREGTRAIYEAMVSNEKAYTLVGGGDTLASIGMEEHLQRIDHVSTGGGAMLKLLEAGTLPGIEVLG